MKIRIASLRTLPADRGVAVTTEGMEIALFRIDGKVYAIENLCPHQHVPVLSEGSLEGTILTCPMHGWRYELTDGTCVHASGRLKTFKVEIAGDDVSVEIDDEEQNPWW